MIVVVSQAWTRDEGHAADSYIALSEEFAKYFDNHPGFVRRMLIRGQEDRTHFTNLRFFDSVDSYTECTQREGYVAHTELMYEHLVPYESYPREFCDVVLDTGASDTDASDI